jgi:sugar/nucleoside kinase (ribokinase family)
VVISSAGGRSFISRNGGNDKLSNRHLPDAVLKSAGIIHVGGALKMLHLDLEELFRRAKSFGATTSLDTDWDPNGLWMKRLGGALAKTDYLITNQEEAAMLAGKEDPSEAARELLARGAQVVIVKRGERGSMLFSREAEIDLPAYRVTVRDTTCAGDSFVAGFLFGLSRGRPLAEAMRLGNAAGGLCTTQLSHRGITSLADVQKLIQDQPLPTQSFRDVLKDPPKRF